ncbi:MAG: hypothetical protein KCHDKBKB_00683 [Elusimicrobia bacterium]|nr:hypothetical protein [Elusimicrobiota bacterium]
MVETLVNIYGGIMRQYTYITTTGKHIEVMADNPSQGVDIARGKIWELARGSRDHIEVIRVYGKVTRSYYTGDNDQYIYTLAGRL